ncbi:hypothetical protein D3OALGA1CA_3892 [Olavius algarvensis associated proteobacterium Delta 3]|nr:hypothetical protein D3OALGA1CA_3892 [Olavius algarvensis associated proteobacterium Delta 3]CAB5167100.1 hypothetical protein D3OALGB2SA_5840 [Olavius algarvensis associated proteobacterium Delta 3]
MRFMACPPMAGSKVQSSKVQSFLRCQVSGVRTGEVSGVSVQVSGLIKVL